MDECEELRLQILRRKEAQNGRAVKAGKKPKHKLLNEPKRPSRGVMPHPPESGDEDDTALSFDEWKAAGWCVKKGERSECTDVLGVPQFTRLQVRKNNPAWEKYRARK